MVTQAETPLTVIGRHRARRLAYWNGALWALGNGLATSTLVIYLARELDAGRLGVGVGLILAAPHIVGLLRLSAPAMIGRLADRKRFCVVSYLLSDLVLLGLPVLAAPGRLPTPNASLAAMIAIWCVYHLLEYLGAVALWSWLADLAPVQIRGRFFGRRQRWMLLAEAAAMVGGGLVAWQWQRSHPPGQAWVGYALLAAVGAAFMLAAVGPLLLMPAVATGQSARARTSLRCLLGPLADIRFLPLLLFGCWFSFFNGITQSAQNLYPLEILGISLLGMNVMQTMMRLGQSALGPAVGRAADHVGNRPVMIASQLVVAAGLLFYLLATPSQPWWIAGAWVAWVAYIGMNVCLPNLLLKLAPAESNAPYIACYFAVTALCYAMSTLASGWALDAWRGSSVVLLDGAIRLDFYQASFVLGWIARSMGVLILLLVIERPSR